MNDRTSEYRLVVKQVIAAFLDVMKEPRLHNLSQDETAFWFENLTHRDIEIAYAELRFERATRTTVARVFLTGANPRAKLSLGVTKTD